MFSNAVLKITSVSSQLYICQLYSLFPSLLYRIISSNILRYEYIYIDYKVLFLSNTVQNLTYLMYIYTRIINFCIV